MKERPKVPSHKDRDAALTEALMGSFPASDPVSSVSTLVPGRRSTLSGARRSEPGPARHTEPDKAR